MTERGGERESLCKSGLTHHYFFSSTTSRSRSLSAATTNQVLSTRDANNQGEDNVIEDKFKQSKFMYALDFVLFISGVQNDAQDTS